MRTLRIESVTGGWRVFDGERPGHIAGFMNESDARLFVASEAMRSVIMEIEWHDIDGPPAYCPSCTSNRLYGHGRDCKLAAALTLAGEPKP